GRVGTTATATVRLSDLKGIAAHRLVRHIALGQGLRDPNPLISSTPQAAPRASDRAVGNAHLHKHGAGVLVGIIDVQGFDFSHPDFLDARGRTRFEAIWDQGAAHDDSMPDFGYGRVITRMQMDAALAAAPRVGAPAFELEPQSQMVRRSHGTHVASIAAGNLGVARKAKIAAVLVSLGPDDLDRRRSFYDSTRLAHAVTWLLEQGRMANMPVSINVSLGTNGHAHDSSAPVNRWIDSLLAIPGRSVCVAAGNAGQERAETPDDVGFVMGRIHTQGQVAAANLDTDIEWVVAGSVGQVAGGNGQGIAGAQDYSENELEIWFSPQDKISVSVREPGGKWHGPVCPREFIENRRIADGSFISIYNELYHPSNGANYIGVFLSPNMRASPIVGVPAGLWTVRLHGIEIRDGRYDGWIERDDPAPVQPDPEKPRVWAFPSFFTERSNVDNSSISTLACGNRVIGVANLDMSRERINITSSQGPTREGRQKPDIASPGTQIVAANGFAEPDAPWVAMTGTSMASPYVCGVVALMLATRPDLTAAQVNGILQRTATPLPGKGFAWQNDAGFGVINAANCVREAADVNLRSDRTDA
ncbi:MAG TPA: S8 family serine peptidase, partial [Usitatibacter sp.]|nr:S8 family serine peptidase [Usitatibacter sp.]